MPTFPLAAISTLSPRTHCRHLVVTGSVAGRATAGRIMPRMTLPSGFHWTTRSASLPGELPTVIVCDGVWVVAMFQRVDDGTWVATLDRHRNGPGGPSRRCSSYEQGRAGAEMWVARHEARLRDDVDQIRRYREAVQANRLAKASIEPPFGWMG